MRLLERGAEGTPRLEPHGSVVRVGVARAINTTCAGMPERTVAAREAQGLQVIRGHMCPDPRSHRPAWAWLEHHGEAADGIELV